ncbi:MAG: hypothetical protein KDA41_21585, partial [Planctomycetales bacterium]|nr:hypothetical protein [Planctomycetales bacterium]
MTESESSPRSAVVVVVDRLGAGWLGPYGCTWVDTPHFNRLAAESAIFENCLALSPNVADAYAAWWTGRHPGVAASLWPGVDLPTQCAAHGV